MCPPKRLLIVKTGTTEPEVVRSYGDYDAWFEDFFRQHDLDISLCPVWSGAPLPEATTFDGILLTGSPASVRDDSPWMKALAKWTLDAAASEIPVLAVCFGHQLIGEALGGFVTENPAGPEYGTIEVTLTNAGRRDPLFSGIEATFRVQSTHRDSLTRPPEAICLASTSNTEWQAFGWGKHLRAVQFHPEIPSEALELLCHVRGVEAKLAPETRGLEILSNWVKYFLMPDAPAI